MKPSDWHPEDIKAAVRKSGTTLVDLAKDNQLHISTVGAALRRPSAMAEAIIARQIGATPQAIWPSRYDGEGNPVTRRGVRPHPKARNRNVKRQKRGEG